MSEKPNIVHIISRLNTGGIERVTLGTLERNSHRFGTMHLWLVGDSLGEAHMIERAKRANVEIHHHPKSIAGFSAFRSFLKREEIDIVHSHIGYPSGVYIRIAKSVGVQFRFASWHSIQHKSSNPLKRRAVLHLQKMIAKHGTVGFAVSEEVRNSLVYRPLQRLTRILYNGYEIKPSIRTVYGQKLQMLHAGRFHPYKNHKFLWQILESLNIPFKLTACGRHDHAECLPPEATLNGLKAKWKVDDIEEVLSTPGNCNDLHNRMSSSDIFLFPSTFEGLGGVIIEAAVRGCTCFVSDIPAHREIAVYFDNVHLLDIDNGPRVWVDAIESYKKTLVDMEKIWSQFMDSPFTVTHMDNQLFELYGMKPE